MFYVVFFEGDCLIGVVVVDWGWDEEVMWEFCVYNDFGVGVEFGDEVVFDL